jgi:hypothetical protein
MPSARALKELRETFQRNLMAAVADGRVPKQQSGLGPHTISAIEAIANDHPEARVELITEAYDTFSDEHITERASRCRLL